MQNIPSFLKGIKPVSYDPSAEVNKPLFSPSPTEKKIKEISTSQLPEQKNFQAEVYTQERFYEDVIKVKQREKIGTDEAGELVMKAYQGRGIGIEGVDLEAEIQAFNPVEVSPLETSEESGLLEKVQETGDNTIGGFFSQVPEVVGNTLGFLADVVTPKELEGLGQFLRDSGAQDKEAMQELLGVDPDAFATQAGEFTAEIATLASTGGASGAAKIAQKAPVLSKGLANLASKTDKVPKLLKTIGASSTKGAAEMAKFGVIDEGTEEGVVENALIGGIANPVIGGVSKGFKDIGTKVYSSVFRPSKPEAEAIFLEAVGKLSNRFKNKAETAFDQGLSGTQKSIGVNAVKKADKLWKNDIQPLLDTSKSTIKKKDMFSVIEKRVKEEIEPGRKADLAKALEKLKKEYANDPATYTMQHAQKLKSGLDNFTPKKAFKGEDIAQAYKELKSDMANYLRSNLHSKLSGEFGVNTADKYITYANLKGLQEIGVKGIQTGGENLLLTPGGTATLIANLWQTIMTPIQTKSGLTLYNVGDKFTVVGRTGLKAFNEYIGDIIFEKE